MRAEGHTRITVDLNEVDSALLTTLFPGIEPGAAIKLALRMLGEGRQVELLLREVVDRLEASPQQISDLISERFEQLAEAVASNP